MDQVDFEPTPNWSATRLKADDHHTKKTTSCFSLAYSVCFILFTSLLMTLGRETFIEVDKTL